MAQLPMYGGAPLVDPLALGYATPIEAAPFGIAPTPFGFAPPVYAPPVGVLAPPLEPGPGDAAIYEEREEYLAELWAFSRFALPWLVFTFLLLGVVLALTFWQQTGDIKDRYDGVPRRLIRSTDADQNERGQTGQTTEVRNLRISAFVILIVSSIFAFLLFFARPKPSIRTALGIVIGILLIIGAILAWIAFGIALDRVNESFRCPENYRVTQARCRSREGLALGQIALDAVMGGFGIIAGVLLAINAKKGHWRMAPRDWTEEQRDRELEPVKERLPGEMIHKNVSFVRKWLVGIALIITLGAAIGSLILLWIREEDRPYEVVRGIRGRTDHTQNPVPRIGKPWEQEGWGIINTGLRLAGCVGGIVTIFLNFMPFRSRAVIMIFGFLYFACAVVLFICFAFDVDDLKNAHDYFCPRTIDGVQLDCEQDKFIATAVLEFMAAVALCIYVIVEYFIKRGRPKLGPDTIDAAYGVFPFSKTEVRVPTQEKVAAPLAPVMEETIACNLCDDHVHGARLQCHQESECPKRMVLCDQCGDAFQSCRLEHHRRAECACRSE